MDRSAAAEKRLLREIPDTGDGCGFQPLAVWAWRGRAHGNRFRITYRDDRWDEVQPWTTRALDGTNPTKSIFVYC